MRFPYVCGKFRASQMLFFYLFLFFILTSRQKKKPRVQIKRRGGSGIDVIALATAATVSGFPLADWSVRSGSSRDWSDPNKPELHSPPVDSILLQFRGVGGRRRVVTNNGFGRLRICRKHSCVFYRILRVIFILFFL